jgi:hypothetical protein
MAPESAYPLHKDRPSTAFLVANSSQVNSQENSMRTMIKAALVLSLLAPTAALADGAKKDAPVAKDAKADAKDTKAPAKDAPKADAKDAKAPAKGDAKDAKAPAKDAKAPATDSKKPATK